MFNSIASIKAVLSLDNKQFSQGLKKSQKQVSDFGKSMAGAFSGAALFALSKQLAKLNRDIYNSTIAFDRLTTATNISINKLRQATGGMVSDLKLMQQTIQALNLGLRASDLPTFFKFAAVRAAETGVAVDYLVNSIVTGVGRQSRLVLDNLGISLIALNREIARTGDFMSAAVNIINRELDASGRSIEDVRSGVQVLTAELENLFQQVADSKVGEDLEYAARAMSDVVKWAREDISDTWFGKYLLWAARGGVAGSIHRTVWLDWYTEADKAATALKLVAEGQERLIRNYSLIKDISILPSATGVPIDEPTNLFRDPIKLSYSEQLRESIKALSEQRSELLPFADNYSENYNKLTSLIDLYQKLLDTASGKKQKAGEKRIDGSTITPLPNAKYDTGVLGEIFSEAKSFEIPGLEKATESLFDHATGYDAIVEAQMKAGMGMREVRKDIKMTGETILDLTYAIKDSLALAITYLADSLGQLIGGDTQNALQTFISGIAGLMKQFGSMLIAWGIAQIALKASITNPYLAIAAGAALVAIGGLMSSQQSKVTGSVGGGNISGYGVGSFSGNSYGSFGSNYDNNREVVLVARGDDLVATINRANFRYGENG